MSNVYTSTRVRGLANWNPQPKTRRLLAQVQGVLDEYADHLPLTCRQIFYRLVGAHGYPKDERAYNRLLEALNRARRAGLVPFDLIRDDGVMAKLPMGFHGLADFWGAVRHTAEGYRRDRLADQPVACEVWVEAAGMVPQAVRVAHEFGVGVYSSGGFDSLTTKHDAVQRILERDKPTVVLHVGDHDPSGLSVFDSAAEDVTAMVRDLDDDPTALVFTAVGVEDDRVRFQRVVVTEEQIERYQLPEAPAKKTDKRGNWTGGTVQAEALPPDVLAAEFRAAIEAVLDTEVLVETLRTEKTERRELMRAVEEAQP
ncbi:hypothetical protein ACFL6C_03390 [Myxococcota bacterium]